MQKKIVIASGIMMIMLMGIVSAGLVGYLSNMVSGTINVRPPVFYLDKTDIMGDNSFSLKLNSDDVSGDWFQLKSGDTSSREFFSESLGTDSFYDLDFNVVLDSQILDLNESLNETGSVHITMFLSREDGSDRTNLVPLCDIIYLNNERRDEYSITCSVGDKLSSINPADRLKLLLYDGSPSESKVKVYIGNSRVEVVPR